MRRSFTAGAAALVLDQALYSGSNFAFVLAQSRGSDPEEFANFAAGLALLTLFIALGRYLFHEPAMAGVVSGGYRLFGVSLRATSLYWALSVAPMVGVATVLLGPGAFGVAVVAPLVLVQDQRRYQLVSEGGSNRAVLSDAVWLVAVLPMLFADVSVDARSLWWGLAAAAGLAVTWLPHTAVPPRVQAPARTTGRRRYVVVDFLINELSVPIGLLLLVRSQNPESAATFRVVLIPFGVLWVAIGAHRSLGIAEHRRESPATRRERARTISLVSVGLSVVVWTLIQTVPSTTWTSLIGPSWPTAGAIVAIAGLMHTAKAAQTGALLELKADARFRAVCAVRVACGLLPMLVGWVAAVRGSMKGLLAALCVGEILTFVALMAVLAGHAPRVARGDGR